MQQLSCHPGVQEALEVSSLLSVPAQLLQQILAAAGDGGAAAGVACRQLRSTWQQALEQPALAARYLLARYGKEQAIGQLPGIADRLAGYLHLPGYLLPPEPPESPTPQPTTKPPSAGPAPPPGPPAGPVGAPRAGMLALLHALSALLAPQPLDASGLLLGAARAGSEDLAWAALRLGPPCDVYACDAGGHTALTLALRAGRLPLARMVLAAGYDPCSAPQRARGALCAACDSALPEAVRLVLDTGVSVRAHGEQALRLAMERHNAADDATFARVSDIFGLLMAACARA